MPLMDGYELARRLRGLPELEQVKLIALTGYGQSSDRGRTAEAGFDAHLVKPVKLEQVVDAIERLSPRRDRPSP
jgi:CheY-like chemotaxis protein